jgi:hypothetical protein
MRGHDEGNPRPVTVTGTAHANTSWRVSRRGVRPLSVMFGMNLE